jgi:hypothetical protein
VAAEVTGCHQDRLLLRILHGSNCMAKRDRLACSMVCGGTGLDAD